MHYGVMSKMDKTIQQLIDRAKAERPILFDVECATFKCVDPVISDADIANVERERSIKLPASYIDYLTLVGAGEFGFMDIFSPIEDSEWSIYKRDIASPRTRGTFLPFADNGCGDFYCFKVVDGVCIDKVYFLDHEEDYMEHETDYSNFTDFVSRAVLNFS